MSLERAKCKGKREDEPPPAKNDVVRGVVLAATHRVWLVLEHEDEAAVGGKGNPVNRCAFAAILPKPPKK